MTTDYPDHINWILCGFHQLRLKQRHINKSDLARHLRIGPKQFTNWLGRATLRGQPIRDILKFDSRYARKKQRVVDYIREHCGPDRDTSFEKLRKAVSSRYEILNQLADDGVLQILPGSDYKSKRIIAMRDIPQAEMPLPTKWIDVQKYRDEVYVYSPKHFMPVDSSAPRVHKKRRCIDSYYTDKMLAKEREDDERDTRTLAVYHAITQTLGRPDWQGWTAEELSRQCGQPVDEVAAIANYIARMTGIEAMVTAKEINGIKHYRRAVSLYAVATQDSERRQFRRCTRKVVNKSTAEKF